ncbi:MAG: hypothetical protein J6V80_05240 [Clostridia bacterium]|nr:hypothetical protein [Clostridia bacterium]
MHNQVKTITFRASDGNTVKLEQHESLPSTASLAREYAAAGYPDRYVVFTEKQTELSALGDSLTGKDPEKGLYLSCILRPSIFSSQVGCIGPLSALALSNAMEEHTMRSIGIGWVSDIYCDGARIGSTAVEGKLDNFTSYEYLIVSFAVRLDEKKFQPRLTDRVRRVFVEENQSIPMIMAKTVLNNFFAVYKEIKNPEKHLNNYIGKFILNDKKVKYLKNGKKKPAKVIGINKDNITLIIETRDGRRINVSSQSSIILPTKI